MRGLAHIVTMLLVTVMLAACANIGSPEGGPRDFTPPRVLKSSPEAGALNVKGNKVEITFNEIVNIKDQMKKVSVSPVQKDQPIIKSLGKKIVVEFRDDMLPNTTYTIDFSNSIEDNNEGNQLDGYAFSFSTGDQIDTLRIAGIVLRARDLEPMQHVLVGAYSQCLDDTAFTRLPMERITRTNSRGEFTLMGLKPGRYRVFALNDMDGDYHMARTEDYAFIDTVIEPTVGTYTSTDTIFTFDRRVDSVMTATHTAFLPNDLLLSMMNEEYQSLYLKKTERTSPAKLHVLMSTVSPQLPRLDIISPANHEQDWYALQGTARNDSLFYWLTDSTLIKADSIKVALTYLRTDSTPCPGRPTLSSFGTARAAMKLSRSRRPRRNGSSWRSGCGSSNRRKARANLTRRNWRSSRRHGGQSPCRRSSSRPSPRPHARSMTPSHSPHLCRWPTLTRRVCDWRSRPTRCGILSPTSRLWCPWPAA